MIILPDTNYKAEVMIRSSDSEPYLNAKLAKKIWIGSRQVVDTLTADNINGYLYTKQGNPTYAEYGGGGAIWFGSELDIVYMKNGVSCRAVSGRIQGINTNYDNNTTETYTFVVNMTGPVYATITQTKRSYGYYETEFITRISCGNNYGEWKGGNSAYNFSIEYNGSAYVATLGSWTITSENCREQCSRLELAGSNKTIAGSYAGFTALKGVVTTGMARY